MIKYYGVKPISIATRRNAIRYDCYMLGDSWAWLSTCFVIHELFSKKNHNNFVVTQEFIG